MSVVAGCSGHTTTPLTERLIVTDGSIANAFVYISRGLDDAQAHDIPPEPLVISQKGCIYVPHVAAARVGQKVLVENSDGVAHNVKLNSQRNGSQNRAQAAGSPAMEFVFKEPEVPLTLACDYHPWMKSYVCVQEHPYYAITGSDGSFVIEGLAPGKYTVSVWHEAFKTQRQELVVPAGGEVLHDFHFK